VSQSFNQVQCVRVRKAASVSLLTRFSVKAHLIASAGFDDEDHLDPNCDRDEIYFWRSMVIFVLCNIDPADR
jgi:hypothetical protein